jgi:hypothetical protein
MDYQSNSNLYGVIQGVAYGQNERVDELNDRISSRHFADSHLEPNLGSRAIPTKYSHFPIVNRRTPAKEPVLPFIDYNSNANFTPAVSRGPVSGYLNNVDTETILRNQVFANQRGADQNVYVPSSTSELYNVRVVSRPMEQTHPLLFTKHQFNNAVHPNNQDRRIGNETFFNHTRTQLRSMF